ncbi:hypothetical protein HOLleu_09834 [Holothuria leucospilota]|uniref:Uncharacterized protein n=1 Tax=Holothuria leucospilota TaxID=206669 RepID=A0A9Q1HBB1_HOLLE|nr:hypothetical protein HOLleu_09834 [Holothuria leucospilota]
MYLKDDEDQPGNVILLRKDEDNLKETKQPRDQPMDDEDQSGNVIPLRKDEDDLKHTEQSRDQQMEMNDEFSGVSEISESTHLLNEEGTDTSRDDDTQPCLLRERATLSPFDESVIGILREEQLKVKDSEDMGINLRSYVDKEEWNRVKNALKKVTAWYKNLAHVIVLLHVKSCWEEDTLNNFTRGVEQLMNSLKEDSLNDITNFRRRTDALVKKLEETNSISTIQCNEHLKFLKEEQHGDNIEMFKGCLQNILGTTMFPTFRKLIETLFMADVVNYGGKFQAVDASESKTKEQRLDTNLREIMKGINFARFALDEIPPCKGSSLKDTVHLMERINLAIKQSYQNG